MRIVCDEVLHNECPIVFDNAIESEAIAAYQQHAKASHGVDFTSDHVKEAYSAESKATEEKVVEEVVIKEKPVRAKRAKRRLFSKRSRK